MSSWQASVRDELIAVVESVSPDAERIIRGQTAVQISWRQLLENFEAGLMPNAHGPFVVIEWGELNATEGYGDANDSYEWTATIYYVLPRTATDGTPLLETDVENKLMLWSENARTGLRAHAGQFFVEKPSSSYAATIPPNAYFAKNKIPMWAASVTAKMVCGEGPDPA